MTIFPSHQNIHWLLLPWLVEEIIEMVGGIILCFVYTFKDANWYGLGTILLKDYH